MKRSTCGWPWFFVALLFAAVCAADSEDPIIIPTHNWSSQVVMSHVVGQLFEKNGSKVEYVKTDSRAVYDLIRTGEVTIEVEVWEASDSESFNAALEQGGILDAGNHDAVTREDWWYPMYVKEICPGLPDWKALNACSEKFATPETKPKGRFVAGPVGWLEYDAEKIKALDLNFTVVNAVSATALWAALEAAKEKNQPIVLFNWTPNYIEAIHEGEFVDFPEYHPDCLSDAGWGINKDKKYDCGGPTDGYLKKAAHSMMPVTWPIAYELFTRISFTNGDIAHMAALVDVDRMEYEQAAATWLSRNKPRWEAWLKEALIKEVP